MRVALRYTAVALAGVAAAALVVAQPLLALIAAAGLVVMLSLGLIGPYWSVIIAGFLLTAVPKAGVKVGGFPFPFMLFGLVVAAAVILYQQRGRLDPMPQPVFVVVGVVIVWFLARATMLAVSGASPFQLVPLAAWFVVPAVLLALAPKQASDVNWARAMEAGVLAACGLSVVQAIVGVERTLIPGITLAFGDDFASKHVLITTVGFGSFYKIPSSYQNGNTFGVITGFFLVTALRRILTGDRDRWNWILLSATAVASVLAGSRTVIIAVAVASVLVMWAHGSLTHKLAIVVGVVVVALIAVRLQPGLAERFSLSSITDSQGAGRTARWRQVIDQQGLTGLGFGTSAWLTGPSSEGVFGAAEQVGIFGVGALVVLALRVTRHGPLRQWRFPLVVILICFLLDSSYLLFPTLFIPFVRMWSPFSLSRDEADQRTDLSAVGRLDVMTTR